MLSESPIEQGDIILVDWAIALRIDGTACFLGVAHDGEHGCMSPEIVEFDAASMIGTTRGGNRFHLRGDRHEFLGTVLWALLRGRSGEPMPRFIAPDDLALALHPCGNAMRC